MFFGKENYDRFITHQDSLVDYIKVTPVEIKNIPYEYRQKYFPNSFEIDKKKINSYNIDYR